MLSNDHFMQIAETVADAGTCSRLKVGALLVYSRRIISTGYNGAPAGLTHCDHIRADQQMWDGEGKGCDIAVHAEANAVAFAAKHGIATEGSTLFVTHSPCLNCSRLLINAGVKEVIYGEEYRDARGIGELALAGIDSYHISGRRVLPLSVTSGDEPGVHSSQLADKESFHIRNLYPPLTDR